MTSIKNGKILPPLQRGLCWTLTTGEAGIVGQTAGLAEALERLEPGRWQVEPRTVRVPFPWSLPRGDLLPGFLKAVQRATGGGSLAPPWPELIISCGRRGGSVAVALKKASGGRIFTVHIQNPLVPPRLFDLVVPPRHDRLSGPNVLPTRGALHRLTPEKLAAAGAAFAPRFAALPRPLVAVLVGGSSGAYRLTPERCATLGAHLAALARDHGYGLVLTTSRRTGEDNRAALTAALAGAVDQGRAWIWDTTGDNPYLAMLALADHLLVTEDSVSMISEALSTGTPVSLIPLEGGSPRMRRFQTDLYAEGLARPFSGGPLEQWSYPPLQETQDVAAAVRERLKGRGISL